MRLLLFMLAVQGLAVVLGILIVVQDAMKYAARAKQPLPTCVDRGVKVQEIQFRKAQQVVWVKECK